ncbi:endonuclease/exonuclease/phosphatase family protein [Halorubellus sp. PRR65]|uniref:endonuclease/exonuclease/phosphatase family protein n=1 Tax=Halorubellus sp. PRR65 TaxID=3098148 RepID=UPI002B25C964|nr:endonuclease/exonuclease/phosphatase family protein [Halorubellus sp. PRR65]
MNWDGRLGRVALTAALVVVVAGSLQRTASRVFVSNFSLSGPGLSALLVLGFLSVWTLPVARRLGWERSLRVAVAGLPFAVVASAVADPVLAGAGAVLALSLATPWLVALGARDPAFLPGLAGGVASIAAVRGWLGTLPAYATLGGTALLVGVAVVAAALALLDDVPEPGASAVAWLAAFAQGLFLAYPAATAAWGGLGYAETAVATVAGVVVGVAWVGLGRALGRREAVVVAVAFALSLADVVWVGQLGSVAVLLVQVTFLRLVAAGLRDDGVSWLALAQVVGVVAVATQVLAANWAYVPGGAALAGHAPLSAFALAAAPVVAAVLVLAREAAGVGGDPTELANADRRDALAALAPGALAALSLAPGTLASTVDDDSVVEGTPYDVLTLNVHQWVDGASGDANYRDVRDLLAEHDPDVVGLQETEGGRYTNGSANPVRWLADELDYHHDYGVPTRRGGYGVAVLSRYPVLDTTVVSLPVHRSPARWALLATLDAPDGPLQTVVTHFQTDGPADDEQLGEAQTVLGELFSDDHERAVVLGDFNVQPDQDPAYDRLKRDLTDAWTAAGHPETGGGGTWPVHDPRQRIDYVWLEGDWSVSRCERVGDAAVSDHLGVLATVDPATDAEH